MASRRLKADLHPRKKFWLRPLVVIIVILSIAALSILALNRPSPKLVRVSAQCKAMILPVAATLKLPRPRSIHLRGFQGSVRRVEGLLIGGKVEASPLEEFRFLQSNSLISSASFLITPRARHGPQTIALEKKVEIQGIGCSKGAPSALKLISVEEGDINMNLEAEEFEMTANRAKIDPPGSLPGQYGDGELKVHPLNRLVMVQLAFSSVISPPDAKNSEALITFDKLTRPLPVGFKFPVLPEHGEFLLRDCQDPIVLLGDKAVVNSVKSRALDLALSIVDPRITNLEIADGHPGYCLGVGVEGVAGSVRQGNRELNSTRLGDLLDKPPGEKGIWGMGALFLLFAGGIFLKRALEVLAEFTMPDAKDTEDSDDK